LAELVATDRELRYCQVGRIADTVSDAASDRLMVYADESFDGGKERVAAVAGLIGTETEWVALESAWVERTDGKEFHANKCETEFARDPDPDKHRANLRLYADLANIVADSKIRGYGPSFDIASYLENFPGANPEYGFYHGFTGLLKRFGNIALTDRKQVEFTFDNRQGMEYNMNLLYEGFIGSSGWKGTGIFFSNKINFDTRKNPRIQAADLIAREAMKFLDNYVGPVRRTHRESLKVLANHRIQFDAFEGPYFKDFRAKMPELEKRMRMNVADYHAWLLKSKQPHNESSLFRFIKHLDETDPLTDGHDDR
jgi:hypothetical protein